MLCWGDLNIVQILHCFRSTLYVGEHPFGLYALPSLVDQSVATVNHLNFGALLIEGPNGPPSVNLNDASDKQQSSTVRTSTPSSSLDLVLPSKNEIDVSPSYPLIILGK